MIDNAQPQARQLLTIREAAKRLNCSPTSLYSQIKDHAIPMVRVGKTKGYRIDPDDLDAFIEGRKFVASGQDAKGVPLRPRLKHIKF